MLRVSLLMIGIALTGLVAPARAQRPDSTNSFYLSVGIRVGQRGTPPAYVARANQPQFKEPGTATRTRTSNGSDSLTVKGIATKGTKVDVEMTLVCQP